MSSQSDDDIFNHSLANNHHQLHLNSLILTTMRNFEDFYIEIKEIWNSLFDFLADTLNSLVHTAKSNSFSTQENGENERNSQNSRKISVLDEKALREDDTKIVRDQRIETMSRCYETILGSIGEDPSRQGRFLLFCFIKFSFKVLVSKKGLLKTPKRAAEVRLANNSETIVLMKFSFRLLFSLPKVTNNQFEMLLVMQYSMKTVKIWLSSKKLICIPSVNITCKFQLIDLSINTDASDYF